MGILDRFKNIMSSNINAVLDKMEDPEKMIDQILRDLNKDLGKVKAETATVLANERRIKRQIDESVSDIKDMESYAMRALEVENEDDAKKFIERKQILEKNIVELNISYDLAVENSKKMVEMHQKLKKDILEVENRRDELKTKASIAKTKEKLNKIINSKEEIESNLSKFDKMEAKINTRLDRAAAMEELDKSDELDMDNLKDKYSERTDNSIETELNMLKEKLKK